MSCDTRYWTLMHGRDCGPIVVETQSARRPEVELPFEVIDRETDPLPPYEPQVVA